MKKKSIRDLSAVKDRKSQMPLAELSIFLYKDGVCEMIVGGDELALRAAVIRNIAKITSSLGA